MDYLEYIFTVNPLQPASEILIAQLAEVGFESFVETETGITAYIRSIDWHNKILEDIQILNSEIFTFNYTVSEIKQINWNAEWEKHFNPIVIDNICSVRAPFHPKFNTEYDIIIEPKMSFGTGHHETTYMMIKHILKTDFTNKTVLDMGCGTAVLAILTAKKGAKFVDAVDIDDWCYQNSLENITNNHCKNITVIKGDANVINKKTYDIIIANINRNILLDDMEIYAHCLNTGGSLFLSGFYKDDIAAIKDTCNKFSLKHVETLEKNQWVALKFLN